MELADDAPDADGGKRLNGVGEIERALESRALVAT
jgi:hypothetical protein